MREKPGMQANLSEALKAGSFALTLELVPDEKGASRTADIAQSFAAAAAEAGRTIHAFSLTDNAGGRQGASADAAALELLRRGLCPLVHVTCRDANRLAIMSRIRGLRDAEVRHFFIVTGDYPADSPQGRPAAVFDLDSVQAIRLAKSVAPDIFAGAAVSPFKETEAELMGQFFKMERKAAAGADFIICQLGYEMRRFLEAKAYLEARRLDIPLLGNIFVPTSASARAMNFGRVPGCVFPDDLLIEFEKAAAAPDKGRSFRLELAASMLAVFQGAGFSGAHIGGFGLKPADLSHLLARGAEIGRNWPEALGHLSRLSPSRRGFYAFSPPVAGRTPLEAAPALQPGRSGRSPFYAVMRVVYRLIFDPRSAGFRLMRSFYRVVDSCKPLARLFHGLEWCMKFALFRCQDCGDCALHDMAYCCPQAKCFKHQRNGPCGGSRNGMCEVDTSGRPCVWTEVYRRMKAAGELDRLRNGYVSPRNTALEGTSGWGNYFMGRDHAGAGSLLHARSAKETEKG